MALVEAPAHLEIAAAHGGVRRRRGDHERRQPLGGAEPRVERLLLMPARELPEAEPRAERDSCQHEHRGERAAQLAHGRGARERAWARRKDPAWAWAAAARARSRWSRMRRSCATSHRR